MCVDGWMVFVDNADKCVTSFVGFVTNITTTFLVLSVYAPARAQREADMLKPQHFSGASH